MGRYIGPGGIVEDDYGPIDRPRSSKMNYASCRSSSDLFLVGNAQRSLDNWQISVPRGLATPCAVIWVIYWFLPPRFYPLGHPRGIFWAAIIFHQLIRLTWFFFCLRDSKFSLHYNPIWAYAYCIFLQLLPLFWFKIDFFDGDFQGDWGPDPPCWVLGVKKNFFSKFQNIGFPKMYTCNEV